MSGFRLNTHMWVSAHLRQCDIDFMPATVVHKGDSERGLILLKHYVSRGDCTLYKQGYREDGGLEWRTPLGLHFEESKADSYIMRERKFDEDLWVIEIEDPKGKYILPE